MKEKQASNNAGLFVTRETSNRVRDAEPVFVTREPNSFDDLGGEYSSVSRRVFGPSRQRSKGNIVDLDASGGWNEDLTQNNMLNTLEGFCFAAKRQQLHFSNAAAVAATDDFTVTATAGLIVGHILFAEGFTVNANNGIHVVDGITDGTHVSTSSALADEVASPDQVVQVVGYQFPADDVDIAAVGGLARLTSAAIDFADLDLLPGSWVFVGGQSGANRFADVLPGYARVYAVADDGSYVDFDKTTFAVATDDGAGTTLQLFFGSVIRNEDDPDLIVQFTHTVERTLGKDDDGRQSEYIDGFVYNEMTWNSPLADKVTIDIKGVAMSHDTRTGLEGPLCEDDDATIVGQMGEDPFNTSSNVYRLRLSILDPTNINPTPLFARCTDWKATIKNNVTGDKAQGTLGAFDATAGMFDVDLEGTWYFSTVAAIAAIRANADVTFDAIYSKQNAAVIVDVPLLGMSSGKLTVEMDKAIMLPAKLAAGEAESGHTVLFNFLPYVPNVGMATG